MYVLKSTQPARSAGFVPSWYYIILFLIVIHPELRGGLPTFYLGLVFRDSLTGYMDSEPVNAQSGLPHDSQT